MSSPPSAVLLDDGQRVDPRPVSPLIVTLACVPCLVCVPPPCWSLGNGPHFGGHVASRRPAQLPPRRIQPPGLAGDSAQSWLPHHFPAFPLFSALQEATSPRLPCQVASRWLCVMAEAGGNWGTGARRVGASLPFCSAFGGPFSNGSASSVAPGRRGQSSCGSPSYRWPCSPRGQLPRAALALVRLLPARPTPGSLSSRHLAVLFTAPS